MTKVSRKNEALYNGLKAICDHPGSSSDSKTLARLALEMNTREVGKKNLLRARELMMKELASPSGQSLPVILERLTLDWSEDISGTRELEYLVWYGASAVKEHLGNEPEKKYVLDFCLRLYTSYVSERSLAMTCRSALRHLEETPSVTAGRIFSTIILEALKDFDGDISAGNMSKFALDAIVKSPFAAGEEKILAKRGSSTGSGKEQPSKRYAEFRKALEAIAALTNTPDQELQKAREILSSPAAENGIVLDNEVVTIDGVKLARKK
jgi:hypothetical protein